MAAQQASAAFPSLLLPKVTVNTSNQNHHQQQIPIKRVAAAASHSKPFFLLTTCLQESCCYSIKQAKQIHASILRNASLLLHEHQNLLYARLFLFLALQTTHFSYAALIFEQLLQENVATIFMWNTMIRSHTLHNSPMQSIFLYNRMRNLSILPNNYTFTFLIKASAALPTLPLLLGRAIHAQTIIFGIPNTDVHIQTALINLYTSRGQIESARSLFDRMQQRTAATWNAMIAGYAKFGDIEDAQNLFDAMPDMDEQCWNVVVPEYARSGVYNAAGMLSKGMPVKTLPTWNTMIGGYIQCSRAADALKVFRRMQSAGVMPDKITIVTILPACAQLGTLELGEWFHKYAEKNGFISSVTVCNALMDMYAKCGNIDKAMTIFEEMREPSVVSWNTMISGLAIHGQAKEATKLFEAMDDEGFAPDDITFVGLLSACGHAGFVDMAWAYFERMLAIYHIQPKMEHYGCMVDALGRAQRLDEALNLVDSMPFEPNSVIWGSLLSACRNTKDFQLGEMMLQKLVDLEPLNSGYYVLLSNMYACSGRWRDVTRVRNLMKSIGIEKTPGCSLIEVDDTVHEFVAREKTHPQTQEIYAKLGEISERLHSVGYVPDTSAVFFDLDEEEKAQNLSFHSEKLAVAFGLLSTSTRKPIRVVKNLRVCNDCHSALKLISEVYDRQIIVRDRHRFHHFDGGKCSCNDYW